MSARNVSLTDHLAAFLDSQVTSGRHQNASEVVREALRRYEFELRLEQEEVAAIREVIREGRAAITRGDFTLVDGEDDREALRARLSRRSADVEHGQR
jgi:antitoxin ParD1/3/4